MDNNITEGVRYIYEDQFLAENPVATLKIRRLEGNYYRRNLAIQRAQSLHGKQYHVRLFNCEHFANYVQYNIPFSKQVDDTQKGLAMAASVFGAIALLGLLFGE